MKFGENCEIWWKLWNLVEIVKFSWNCEIWWKLWNLVEIVKFGRNCEIWSKLWNLVDFWLKLWNSNFYTCCFDCRRLQATQYFTDMEYWDVCFLMLNIIRTGTHGDRISLGTHFSNFVTWKLMFSIWRQNVNNITSKNEFWFLSCISMI